MGREQLGKIFVTLSDFLTGQFRLCPELVIHSSFPAIWMPPGLRPGFLTTVDKSGPGNAELSPGWFLCLSRPGNCARKEIVPRHRRAA